MVDPDRIPLPLMILKMDSHLMQSSKDLRVEPVVPEVPEEIVNVPEAA